MAALALNVYVFVLVFAQISITACKDQPETPLTALMKKEGEKEIKMALGSYVSHLKKRQYE